MKIAFVGKGGSGKTTLSCLFASMVSHDRQVLLIDADLNMHVNELFGMKKASSDIRISERKASEEIRRILIGKNSRIKSVKHFRKTTPPGRGSYIVRLEDPQDVILSKYSVKFSDNLRILTVGSYSEDGIGSSCYHNNLSILENILSHTDDNGIVVVDMVAGIDAFANTLHAQFDMLALTVEPTKRSVSVYEQYVELAKAAGVESCLRVVGNKINSISDEEFIQQQIADQHLLGMFHTSTYLAEVDKGRAKIEYSSLEDKNKTVLQTAYQVLQEVAISQDERRETIYDLHKIYTSQDHIKNNLGDLSDQIDRSFRFN